MLSTKALDKQPTNAEQDVIHSQLAALDAFHQPTPEARGRIPAVHPKTFEQLEKQS